MLSHICRYIKTQGSLFYQYFSVARFMNHQSEKFFHGQLSHVNIKKHLITIMRYFNLVRYTSNQPLASAVLIASMRE